MNEREIFETAIDISNPGSRQVFLRRACGGNSDLMARVESLLAAHDAAGAFLQIPALENRGEPSDDSAGQTQMMPDSTPGQTDRDTDDQIQPDLRFLEPSNQPGSIGALGHYQIQQILGRGGFGIVFRAFDEKLQRPVAIKVLEPSMCRSSPPRKRFLREARAAARVRHENVVQIYSVEEQPIPYLVMELIQGKTLQERLNESGPLEIREVVHVARQIAHGLAAAHALGLIHRDIKPGNILLEDGTVPRVKITDFGLARTTDDASISQSGVVAGTPMYMSPEQATGAAIDHRSDLFSLGTVMYAIACGRPPFRAPGIVAVLRRVADEQPRPLRQVLEDIPAWFESIVEKLHAKNPEERYQSADELARLLARCETEHGSRHGVTSVDLPRTVASGTAVRAPGSRLMRHPGLLVGLSLPALVLGVAWLFTPPSPTDSPPDRDPAVTTENVERQLPGPASPADQPFVHPGWPVDAPAPAIVPFDAPQARIHQQAWADFLNVPVEYENSIGMKFALIPPGEFLMGCSPEMVDEMLQESNESSDRIDGLRSATPRHRVVISRPFFLGIHEVTQRQYEAITGNNPSEFSPRGAQKDRVAKLGLDTAQFPVECVTWMQASEFCRQLSLISTPADEHPRPAHQAGADPADAYRLPTEAEWEFACRGGALSGYWNGDESGMVNLVGWTGANSDARRHRVGERLSNPFGLHDVHGNVWEWVQDGWEADAYQRREKVLSIDPVGPTSAAERRILKGGSAYDEVRFSRSGIRLPLNPIADFDILGFRVALSIDHVRREYEANRRLAEWVLSLPGPRSLVLDSGPRRVIRTDELPAGPFRVTTVAIDNGDSVSDGDFRRFKLIGSLRKLTIGSQRGQFSRISNQGIETLSRSQSASALRVLRFQGRLPQVTDASLPALHRLQQLSHCTLPAAFTTEGLANLALPELATLSVDESGFGDLSCVLVGRLRQLKRLSVNATRLSDAGLAQLARSSALASLNIVGCQGVTVAGVRAFLAASPGCQVRSDFDQELGAGWHGWPANAPLPAIAPFTAELARQSQEAWASYLNIDVEFTNSLGMKFVLIPPGQFLRGSSQAELDRLPINPIPDSGRILGILSETPRHTVILTRPFYLGVHEVTQSQFETLTANHRPHHSPMGGARELMARLNLDTRNFPVDSVSWNDAQEFCAKLWDRELTEGSDPLPKPSEDSRKSTGYHLPTEAQWEFACRAGTLTSYWSGDNVSDIDGVGSHGTTGSGIPHAVGSLRPNPFGLYDVHGNAWEWVQDFWNRDAYEHFAEFAAVDPVDRTEGTGQHVMKGGNFWDTPVLARSGNRFPMHPAPHYNMFGFRLAISVESVRRIQKRSGPALPSNCVPSSTDVRDQN